MNIKIPATFLCFVYVFDIRTFGAVSYLNMFPYRTVPFVLILILPVPVPLVARNSATTLCQKFCFVKRL